ncbi:TadA family conjugal transfer-associated ATPase [Amycolatopsis roodepoortensis]|uniref:TadA family conjugal transfer-associated ATPase n=1 Tax=Amycolatopsis roodepoortensis TaxID=700274 RepID=UPI00214B0C80|nr:TadA family conjugal transfer-associated ATPase [Amycolatopsis roodepoortensis]UUV27698.1 TadA family conjugal transfer-associated ATPase [Amycolatopsis roodepoortensis]
MTEDLVERVRRRLAGSDAPADPVSVARAVRAEAGGALGQDAVLGAVRLARDEFVGAGPLAPLLEEPGVTDILVTAPDEVWMDTGKGPKATDIRFADEEAVRRLAQRLALAGGRRLDDAQPFADCWLPGVGPQGRVRMHAVLPPLAPAGTSLSLRVLRPATHDLAELRLRGVFGTSGADLLDSVIRRRLAFVVSGGTGTGKTTLLAALLGAVPPSERIVCVEDAGELQPDHPQFVSLLTRPANVEGAGEIGLSELVRQALRMRPDRLVVGEVRGGEVIALLNAMNTGHEGGGCTLHANSSEEVPARMEALAALGGLKRDALHSQLTAAVRVVLHMVRLPSGIRRLDEVGVLRSYRGEAKVVPVWSKGTWIGDETPFEELAA